LTIKVGHLIANSSNPTVGVLALPGQVDVRIAAKAANREEAMKMIAPVEAEVRGYWGRRSSPGTKRHMELVTGKLLREKATRWGFVKTDLLSVGGSMQSAASDNFGAGFICNSDKALRSLLKTRAAR
jgi:hypothetical protein